jgi:hypothetical protein
VVGDTNAHTAHCAEANPHNMDIITGYGIPTDVSGTVVAPDLT